MSRRKQSRPVKLLDEEVAGPVPPADAATASTVQQPSHAESSASCSEEDASIGVPVDTEMMTADPLMCPRCQEQFTEVPEFLAHKTACEQKAQKHQDTAHSDPEDMVVSEYEDDEEDEEGSGKRLEQARRHRQDAANNNSVDEDGSERDLDNLRIGFPFPIPPSASHVTLEALQNTKVAVAQFAATAMANNADNEAALQELAVLQSTLFTLQHQQVFQLQLINQLQQQLSLNRSKDDQSRPASPTHHPEVGTPDGPPATTSSASPIDATPVEPSCSPLRTTSPSPIVRNSNQSTPPMMANITVPTSQHLPTTLPPPEVHHLQLQKQHLHDNNNSVATTLSSMIVSPPPINNIISTPDLASPPIPTNILQHMGSISSSLAASIITNNDPMPNMDEPNTLEMLQKRAQEVLDNASQGLLANNLADELAFRKSKGSMSPYDGKSGRNEPFFKHRCRYCGKVFGSDSALQIHIRSHTGERPFKCNVCGSRFTTKGNLKVHFQRHTQKFPHIKMNPNPVPEHLDKYHPPLLAQMGQQSSLSPGGPVHHAPHPFPPSHPFPSTIPIFRPSIPPPEMLQNRLQPSPHRPPQDLNTPRVLPPHPLFVSREEQDAPADLSKPARSSPPPTSVAPEAKMKTEPIESTDKRETDEPKISSINNTITPKQEMDIDPQPDEEVEPEHEPYQSSPTPYDDCSMDSKYSNEDMLGRRSPLMDHVDNPQEEPENLSNKVNSITAPLSISTGQRLAASFNFPHASSPPSSTSSGSLGPFSVQSHDPAKDPAIYASLLPRPGSNDNSWESLIEVTKTSETYKLQQLVDNIEHKLTDPNQCVICHRVLSCKSALQMHYRTHTGERPFKCKICGRAFTTKGNLKTHMGVHRAKPPMRVLHQCPVCHKKFTNALVLQQHIRLHTGEPTDLSPEQIQAAEIKDFPSPGGFPTLPNSIHPFLGQNFSVPNLAALNANLPLNMKMDFKGEDYPDDDVDDDDDDDDMSLSDHHLPSFSTSLAALENQVRTITTMASQLSASNCSAEDLCSSRTVTSTPTVQNGDKSPTQLGIVSPNGSEIRSSPNNIPVQIPRPPSSNQQPNSPAPSESNSLGALDLTPRASQQPVPPSPGPSPGPPPMFSNFGLLPPSQGTSPLMSSALSSLTSSVLTSTAFSPLGLAVGPAGAFAPIRGNTTCNICFKTFACNSALEIHYRSHTKERPFKCTVCDRGFSTKNHPECTCRHGQRRIQDGEGQKPRRVRKKKPPSGSSKIAANKFAPLAMTPGYATALEWTPLLGNMKQHMLTHKIRDMPQHMFEKPPGSGIPGAPGVPQGIIPPPVSSASEETSPAIRDMVQQVQQQHQQAQAQAVAAHQQQVQQQREREQRELQQRELQQREQLVQQREQRERDESSEMPVHPPPSLDLPVKTEMSIKRATSESELPIPKRPPNVQSSKHLCHVCNKNFSSSSALQIHMRTHTGDKPFRCTVCQKAFTTKGNLKVHMGTHMWSNGASRRGRRMSLDLPPIPMTPKDSEFLQRRPDLFYPYLPAPFLNGMQQKLNEISVIQNASNGLPNAGKYTGLLSFGYPPPDVTAHAQPESPVEDKSSAASLSREPTDREPSRDRDVLPRVWDLHYERKASSEAEVSSSPVMPAQPPPLNLQPPSRGEGLAA